MTYLDRFNEVAYITWGLGGLCALTVGAILLVAAVSRFPLVTVVEPQPEPVDDRPAHHASDEMAANHTHHGRHEAGVACGTRAQRWRDSTITGEIVLLDEETGPIARGTARVFVPAPAPQYVAYFAGKGVNA